MIQVIKKTALFAESWNVAFRKKEIGTIVTDTKTPFTIIKNNFRYWAADPFVVEEAGHTYIFAELYDYLLCRGVLGYCKIENKKVTKWKPVITEEHHLSYPCVIKEGDNFYMIPESADKEELICYEAVQFPDRWKKKKILRSNIKLADTTPLCYGDWKSKNAISHCVDNAETPQLILIDLEGKREDVILDEPLFRSRPAGHFFEWHGNILRPAQISEDYGDGYGKGLAFYQWERNVNSEYKETEIKEIFPEMLHYDRGIFLKGMHTYNGSENYEVIDIKTRRFNILNFMMRIIKKII